MWAKTLGFGLVALFFGDELVAQSGDLGCRFRLEVFLDRSGSVQEVRASGKSDYQEVLEALKGMLVTADNHLLDDDDEVQIEHFPPWETAVQPQIGASAAAARFDQLIARPAASTPFTDLRTPLVAISERVGTATDVHRRVFLIVSDFLHDPEDPNDAEPLADLYSWIAKSRRVLEKAFPSPASGGAATVRQPSGTLPLVGSPRVPANGSTRLGENILLLYVLGVRTDQQEKEQQKFLASLAGIYFQRITNLRDLERAVIEHSYRLASEAVWEGKSTNNSVRHAKVTLINRNCCAFTVCEVWVECDARAKAFSTAVPLVLEEGGTAAEVPIELGDSSCLRPVVGVSGRLGAVTGGAPRSCIERDVLPVFEELPLLGDDRPPEMRAIQASYKRGWFTPGRLQLNLELRGRFQPDQAETKLSVQAIGLDTPVKLAPVILPQTMSQECASANCLDAREWYPFHCTVDLGRQVFPRFAYLPLQVEWQATLAGADPLRSSFYKDQLASVSTPTFAALSIPSFLWAITLFVVWLTGEYLVMATVASLVTIVGASSFALGANYLVNPVAGFEDYRRVLFQPEFLFLCLFCVCLFWGLLTLRRHRLERRCWWRKVLDLIVPFGCCCFLLFLLQMLLPKLLGDINQRWGESQALFQPEWGEEICLPESPP